MVKRLPAWRELHPGKRAVLRIFGTRTTRRLPAIGEFFYDGEKILIHTGGDPAEARATRTLTATHARTGLAIVTVVGGIPAVVKAAVERLDEGLARRGMSLKTWADEKKRQDHAHRRKFSRRAI